MRIVRFDSVGGASGDMVLGALVDLGASLDKIRKRIGGLALGDVSLRETRVLDEGPVGRRVEVCAPESHVHRRLNDILAIIEGGGMSPRARDRAARIFRRLAEAEAAVHSIPVDHVHFHEVGALDAIVDIAGACEAMEDLGVDAVELGPLPIGHGTVTCAHGVLPLPAPATVELLKGYAIEEVEECLELVTPTGAAILTTLASESGGKSGGHKVLVGAGCGYGQRRLRTRPNILRALLLEVRPADPVEAEDCLVLECNIDDMTPELIGTLFQQLMGAGALDVFTTSVMMKKQRQAALVTVLCTPDRRETMLDTIFLNSTTFGVREYNVRRTVLTRRHEVVQTPFGPVRMKVGTWRDRDVVRSPEYEDCVAAAKSSGVPVRVVYESAARVG